MWRNFRFLLIFHVQKFEISPHDRFFLHGHRPCVRDKYEVCVCIKCIQKHMGNEEEGKKRAKPQTNRMPYLQYLYIAFVKNRSSSVCQKLGLGLKKMKPAG